MTRPDYRLEPSIPELCPRNADLHLGYAYLIVSDVRVPELYPILGELLFGCRVVSDDSDIQRATNAVGIFIDDEPALMLSGLRRLRSSQDPSLTDPSFIRKELQATARDKRQQQGSRTLPHVMAWMDTFGTFRDVDDRSSDDEADEHWVAIEGEVKGYGTFRSYYRSLVGAGNPMGMFHFLRATQDLESTAAVSIYLIQSITNCYRNLGFSDTTEFLKVAFRSIWSNPDASDHTVGSGDGILFAVMQCNVMRPEETSYLESFFDGIITISPHKVGALRLIEIHAKELPLVAQRSAPILYLPTWQAGKLRSELANQGIAVKSASRYGVVLDEASEDGDG